jgi:hypothetical protein
MQQSAFYGVADQKQARTVEGAGVQQAERAGRPVLERPHAVADHAGTDHEVQLVYQAVGKQVVPEDVTAEYQDLPPRPLRDR